MQFSASNINGCNAYFISWGITAEVYYHDVSLSFSWRSTEGDNALCECCDANDCFGQTGEENSGHNGHQQDWTTHPETGFSTLDKQMQSTQSLRLCLPFVWNGKNSMTVATCVYDVYIICAATWSLSHVYVYLTEKKYEADTAVGPLHTLLHSHWRGRLSITKESFPALP